MDNSRQTFQIPVYVHNLEQDWLENPAKNGSTRFGESIVANAADQLIHEDDTLQIGPFSFSTLHTPGHSPGSVSYYFQDEHVVFSGDVYVWEQYDVVVASIDTAKRQPHRDIVMEAARAFNA